MLKKIEVVAAKYFFVSISIKILNDVSMQNSQIFLIARHQKSLSTSLIHKIQNDRTWNETRNWTHMNYIFSSPLCVAHLFLDHELKFG